MSLSTSPPTDTFQPPPISTRRSPSPNRPPPIPLPPTDSAVESQTILRLVSPFKNYDHHPLEMDVGTAKRVGTAFAMRVIRTVKKGQLPLLLLFFSCVLVFFGALTGFGYVDPDSPSLSRSLSSSVDGVAEFIPGQPVFDKSVVMEEETRLEEMRRLEEEWGRKKRPKDGAWMKKQRDQRAVRRVPLPSSPIVARSIPDDVGEA